jgi:hypothetical protein
VIQSKAFNDIANTYTLDQIIDLLAPHALWQNASVRNDLPLTVTRQEAAKMCNISVQTFDTWVAKGILPKAIAGTRRWSRVAIERAIAGEYIGSTADDNESAFVEWKRNHARKS